MSWVWQTALAVAFALTAALLVAWGTVLRHQIAADLPAHHSGSLAPLLFVIRVPKWWLGTAVSLAGFTLQGVALAFGTLLLVQPLLVLALMFTLPLSARYTGHKVKPLEWFWALVLTVCVAVVVVAGKPAPAQGHPGFAAWTIASLIGLTVIGILARIAKSTLRRDSAMLLGICAGIAFGYVAVSTKALVDRFSIAGLEGVITSGELYGLIIAAAIGTAIQQSSFHSGAIQQSLPAMTVTEPIVAITLGFWVLGEAFRATDTTLVVVIIAAAMMAISTVMLARSEAEMEAETLPTRR